MLAFIPRPRSSSDVHPECNAKAKQAKGVEWPVGTIGQKRFAYVGGVRNVREADQLAANDAKESNPASSGLCRDIYGGPYLWPFPFPSGRFIGKVDDFDSYNRMVDVFHTGKIVYPGDNGVSIPGPTHIKCPVI